MWGRNPVDEINVALPEAQEEVGIASHGSPRAGQSAPVDFEIVQPKAESEAENGTVSRCPGNVSMLPSRATLRNGYAPNLQPREAAPTRYLTKKVTAPGEPE